MSQDPYDLDAAETANAERQKSARTEQEREAADITWLMSSKRGRRMVWRLLERAGVFRLSFSTNSMQMAFAEGNRNEGLRTLGLIHAHCSESYTQMLAEATKE